MKLSKLALGFIATSAIVAGFIMLSKKRKHKLGKILSEVADEGYETAHDILYPRKKSNPKHLKYGPVLPV